MCDGTTPTIYNDRLNTIGIYKLDAEELSKIVEHFQTLLATIRQLEKDEVFVIIDRKLF